MTAAVLFALSSALTWQLSGLLSVLSGTFVLFLAFVCPLWFMHVQESKKYVTCMSFRRSARRGFALMCIRLSQSLTHECGSCSEILGPWDIAHIQPEQ